MAGHGPSELWRNVQGYFITRRTAHPTKKNTLTISLFFLRKTTTTATLDKTEKDLLGPLLVRVFDLTNHLFICTTLCRLKNYFLSYYVSHICSEKVNYSLSDWGISSNGRAPALHEGGTGIDTRMLQLVPLPWLSISFVNFNIWLFQQSLATV